MTETEDIRKKFVSLACQLSPENLSCDGELSRSRVIARLRSLRAEWRRCERELGRRVTEDEAWGWA